jgi:putative SOS response-associated peptidase YedK
MCFTIEIKLTRDALEKRFSADSSAMRDFEFRYFYRAFDNPLIPVITQASPMKIELMRWGLIPHWAQDIEQAEKVRKGTYNARKETIGEKPSFKRAFEQSRCWILVNGFFEWQLIGKEKIPWYIHQENNKPFAMAGLYDTWNNPVTGEDERSFSIVTTPANQLMEKIHNTKKRMPVILNREEEKQWISKGIPTENHSSLLKPAKEGILKAHTISKSIGSRSADPGDGKIIVPCDYYQNSSLFD